MNIIIRESNNEISYNASIFAYACYAENASMIPFWDKHMQRHEPIPRQAATRWYLQHCKYMGW